MPFLNLNPRPDAARCAALLLAGLLLPVVAIAQDHDHAAPEAEGGAPHFTLRGFSNVDFGAPWGASDKAPGNGNSAFALGQFDLYMISRLSTNISFLGETVFELNENQESGIDVERLQVRYSYSDRFRAALGRGHTPLGFWNEAYHHGALLEPTVDRPEALKFEDDGGILPVHFVGLEVDGKVPLAGGDLGYVAAVANGRGPVPDLVQGAYDANKSKAVVAKLDLSFGSEHTLAFGPSVYHDTIPEDIATPGGHAPLSELILGAHLVYRDHRFDLFSEYFHIRHESDTTHEQFYERIRVRHRRGALRQVEPVRGRRLDEARFRRSLLRSGLFRSHPRSRGGALRPHRVQRAEAGIPARGPAHWRLPYRGATECLHVLTCGRWPWPPSLRLRPSRPLRSTRPHDSRLREAPHRGAAMPSSSVRTCRYRS